MAYPTVITMLGHAAMGFVDSMMVGSLGTAELGAVGFTNIFYFTLVSVFMGTVQIVNTFSAQSYGAGDMKGASSWGWQAIYIGLMAWPVMLLFYFWLPGLFALWGPSVEVQGFSVCYGRIRLYGSGMFMALVALVYFLRGVGMVKTPMVASLVMNVVNLVFDYLLIFGKLGLPEMGVGGAAWASVIAVSSATVVLFVIFMSPAVNRRFHTRSTFRPRIGLIVRMLKVGLPSGVQTMLDITSFTVFIAYIGRMGNIALAANQAALQIEFLGFNICHAFSVATTTLVGQHIGSKKTELATESAKSAFHILLYYLLLLLLVVAIFPTDLIGLFVEDENVIINGVMILYLAMLFMVFEGMGAIAVGALRGGGDTRWPMLIALLGGWAFFLPLAYILGDVLDGGVFGAWIGASIYIVCIAMAYVLRFRAGRWKTIEI